MNCKIASIMLAILSSSSVEANDVPVVRPPSPPAQIAMANPPQVDLSLLPPEVVRLSQ